MKVDKQHTERLESSRINKRFIIPLQRKNNIHSSLFFPEVPHSSNQHFDVCILGFDQLHVQIRKNEAAMEGKEMQENLNDRYNLGEPKSIRAMPNVAYISQIPSPG